MAAYFAFEDPPPDGWPDSAVWAVNLGWVSRRSGAEALKHIVWMPAVVEKSFEAMDGILDRELIAAMHLTRPLMANDDSSFGVGIPAVLPFEPQKISDRMSVQQGSFVWPGNVELSFLDNLQALGGAEGVKKIVAPSALVRGRALEQLRLMNIIRASLFRGLDGFAQSFRQHFVRETREQREARLVAQALLPRIKGKVDQTLEPLRVTADGTASEANPNERANPGERPRDEEPT